jgi:hypothetical protein
MKIGLLAGLFGNGSSTTMMLAVKKILCLHHKTNLLRLLSGNSTV